MSASPPVHPAELPVDELLASCRVQQTRASGPGGQHRNKVSTAIVITHLPTGICGQASERRSQQANRQQAIERLRIALALGVRTNRGPLAGYETPDVWRNRIKSGRIEVSREHADYPIMLAILLDLLTVNELEVSNIAKTLGASSTQVIRFLGREPAALSLVNKRREALCKRKYRFEK